MQQELATLLTQDKTSQTKPIHSILIHLNDQPSQSPLSNRVLLHMQNCQTGQLKLIAILDKLPDSVINALFNHWFCHAGFPELIYINSTPRECQNLHQELNRRIKNCNHNETTPTCLLHPGQPHPDYVINYLKCHQNWEDSLLPLLI
jgi:hypothetical protein